jgi:spore coat protein U-like protein
MEEMTMKKQILSLAAGAALVFAASNSFAGSEAAGSVKYQVVLTAGCTVSTPLGSGAVLDLNGGPIGLPYPATLTKPAGQVSVTCSNMPYKVCVNAGSNPTTAVDGTRRLAGTGVAPLATPTDMLSYTLKDNASTLVGDKGCNAVDVTYTDTTADSAISDTGDGSTVKDYILTADVTIGTGAKPGIYQDTVTAMIVW